MVKVVIINGLATVGKSTFCAMCAEYCKDRSEPIHCYELSTVDFVKEVANYAGWDGVKDEKGRQFLHELKMSMSRYDDIPTKKVAQAIQYYTDAHPLDNFVFFINARESADIANLDTYIKSNYGWDVTKLLLRNDKKAVSEVPELVDDIFKPDYDCTIMNEGSLDELRKSASRFIEDLVYGKYVKKS